MNEGEVLSLSQKCPRCGGEMEGKQVKVPSIPFFSISKKLGGLIKEGDEIKLFVCSKCGYIEFYRAT